MSAFRSSSKRRATRFAVFAFVASMVAGGASAQLSDEVFFEEVPPVLTASRLAQSQADVPGAVTVFDRKTLARLGARDLADVLRFVPGYMVSGYNGAHPRGL